MTPTAGNGGPGLRPARARSGFSLIELMVVVAAVGILAAIAYPSYVKSITKTRRRAAEACLVNYGTYMERYYTTNLSYAEDRDGTAMSTAVLTALGMDCASTANTGADYTYSLSSVSSSAYTLKATPTGVQATRDAACGALTLDQTGTKGVTGTSTATACW
ncbi:MAG: type IV pilin protein [Solimonas sp.]